MTSIVLFVALVSCWPGLLFAAPVSCWIPVTVQHFCCIDIPDRESVNAGKDHFGADCHNSKHRRDADKALSSVCVNLKFHDRPECQCLLCINVLETRTFPLERRAHSLCFGRHIIFWEYNHLLATSPEMFTVC